MNQEISIQRRWLTALASVTKPKAVWLAPVVLSPVLAGAWINQATAQINQPSAQTVAAVAPSNTSSTINPNFILQWLDAASSDVSKGNVQGASSAFAEALRARKVVGTGDAQVEKRLKEVEGLLVGKGVKQQQIVDAIKQLGPMGRLPASGSTQAAVAQPVPPVPAASLPTELPNLPALNTAAIPPAANQPMVTNRPNGNTQVVTAVNTPSASDTNQVQQGVFLPQNDSSRTQPAAAAQSAPTVPPPIGGNASGDELYRRGIDALAKGDSKIAYELFRQAWQFQGEMDPTLRNQLKEKLSLMSASGNQGESVSANPLSPLEQQQLALRQRLMSEVTGEIAAAEANRESEPMLVAENLQTLRTRVSQADLDGAARKQMLTIVDRAITSHQIYMSQNQATIDQNQRNRQITGQMELEDEARYKKEQQIASMVETFHDLMDKGSFAEAEIVAKQVGALDSQSTIAKLLLENARNRRRIMEYEQVKIAKEESFVGAMIDVDRGSIAMTDDQPVHFPPAKEWEEMTKNRSREISESRRGMTAAESAIWDKIKQPVLVDFKAQPLSEVAKTLSDMTGIPIHLDQAGLAMEGFTSEMPVTLSLPSQISLRSALNLILNSQNLDFVVRDEVLMITSSRSTSQANVRRTYNVKDLVLPVPNFVSDYNSGLGGALRNAYETLGRGLMVQTGPVPNAPTQFASASMDPNSPALGQINNGVPGMPGMPGGPAVPGAGIPNGIPPQAMLWGNRGGFGSGPVYGAGNMGMPVSGGVVGPTAIPGGAVIADFDTLMMLIQQTIEPDSWLAAGGSSTIMPYQANLSLVVSAPQTTHEKITDLLESLRQLQDLQVNVEVKFITLSDNFFERIGVDFDIKVDNAPRSIPLPNQGPSTVVGLSSGLTSTGIPAFTSDLNLRLTQDSFTSAVPPFGNFDAGSGASLGLAILSDLELFFFMNAAQGDSRTNILQAPRVTMFDGQTASIQDTITRPFVTTLIPVVADFAVAQQPVIMMVNEGTVLNVQAVVSPDKRFVRVTLNPTFSRIDRVDTFTFEGSRTTRSTSSTTGSNVLNPNGTISNRDEEDEDIISGSTVQQPSVGFTNIATTVSVPDGGTILLGGIKRMREGRIERGVPILSKIPYVNRLFKNTAIGRETSTLMMTVTPRIIIQEEQEQLLGVSP